MVHFSIESLLGNWILGYKLANKHGYELRYEHGNPTNFKSNFASSTWVKLRTLKSDLT